MTHNHANWESLHSVSLLVLALAWRSSQELTLRARAATLQVLLEEEGGRRGQGLNSGLGKLKYSKHKADVALPRLHVNERHMLPLAWQHMCTVYLEDPHCHLKTACSSSTLCLNRGSSPPGTDGMKATFDFLTKRTQRCRFETISKSPISPGDPPPSSPCQEQLNIRKLFKTLLHINCNPITSHSLLMSSHFPSWAGMMPTAALGRLEVTSQSPALVTSWLAGRKQRGTRCSLCLRLFAQAKGYIVSLAVVSSG